MAIGIFLIPIIIGMYWKKLSVDELRFLPDNRPMSKEWDFYFCNVDHKPASLFIDLGVVSEAPIEGLSEMAWLRLYMRNPREDGLSSEAEFKQLVKIEDDLTEAVAADSTIVYVGRNTCDGCRDFYLYCVNGRRTEALLSSVMVAYSDYEFETGSGEDPEWSTYLSFLYPSPREMQVIQNYRVLEQLESQGDDHAIEREICHWLYFGSSENRSRFLAGVIERGYSSQEERDEGSGDRPFALQIARVSAVDSVTINNAVLELYDLAAEHDGLYDGWETSVETGT